MFKTLHIHYLNATDTSRYSGSLAHGISPTILCIGSANTHLASELFISMCLWGRKPSYLDFTLPEEDKLYVHELYEYIYEYQYLYQLVYCLPDSVQVRVPMTLKVV